LSVTDTRTDLISRPHESRSGSTMVTLAEVSGDNRAVSALVALVFVTAVWGVTFVQVKDAVAIYPLFAFLAVRFAIASATLALPAAKRVPGLGRRGISGGVFLGLLLAAGYALQTAGLERTTVSSTGFITGMYVVLTPLIALLLYRSRIGLAAWGGVVVATAGLAMLSGIHAGSVTGDLLVLAAAAVYSLQIVLMERYAPRYDALAFTFVEMAAACLGLLAVALALGDLSVPHGWTVWGALLVTGVFASALGFLVQTWAQRRTSATRTALAFSMEPVWTAFFGYTLAGDRLGALGWGGCAAIMAGIVLAEPAAARVLAGKLDTLRLRFSQ
jgi:drug/metabolite transporter (DMT)-like permease